LRVISASCTADVNHGLCAEGRGKGACRIWKARECTTAASITQAGTRFDEVVNNVIGSREETSQGRRNPTLPAIAAPSDISFSAIQRPLCAFCGRDIVASDYRRSNKEIEQETRSKYRG